ncbi:hypothetical protein HK102_002791 [Quaeritorhiza haematococci]|nr:hypothetical protein HK102_002791 [Quaeritorhiza haematococci]
MKWRLGADGNALNLRLTPGPRADSIPTQQQPPPPAGSSPLVPGGTAPSTGNGTVPGTSADASINQPANSNSPRNQTSNSPSDPVGESATNPMGAAVSRSKSGNGQVSSPGSSSSGSTAENASNTPTSSNEGPGSGPIIATAVGASIALCLLIGLLFWFFRQRKLRQNRDGRNESWSEIKSVQNGEEIKSDVASVAGDFNSCRRPLSSLSSTSTTMVVETRSERETVDLLGRCNTYTATSAITPASKSAVSSPRESLFVLPVTNTASLNTFVSLGNTMDERQQMYARGTSIISESPMPDPIQSDPVQSDDIMLNSGSQRSSMANTAS